jgi:hypothetical protein
MVATICRKVSGTGFSLFAFELHSDSDERQKKNRLKPVPLKPE